MAFLVLSEAEVSPPAMTIPKWILYGIELCIAVVGGENSSTTLTTALHPTAMGL
jgi:hypothetical protein